MQRITTSSGLLRWGLSKNRFLVFAVAIVTAVALVPVTREAVATNPKQLADVETLQKQAEEIKARGQAQIKTAAGGKDAAVFAESALEAIKKFGLAGVWSVDCSRDIQKDPGTWTIVDIPTVGAPKLTVVVRTPTGLVMHHEGEVIQAAGDGESRLKYTWRPTNVSYSDGRPLASFDSKIALGTFERIGSQLRILDNRTLDGLDVFVENGRGRGGGVIQPFQKCPS
jgi:hypothetical protein